jgi:putative transposase
VAHDAIRADVRVSRSVPPEDRVETIRFSAWRAQRYDRLDAKLAVALYTDAQRGRLATAAKKLGRKALKQLDTLVTPDTLMRWYRRLVASKYDGTTGRGTSRPRRTPDIVALVLRMAKENAGWGYTRIRGALFNLGHEIGRNTIKRILLEAGLEPAPERGKRKSWSDFLRAHWGAIPAMDFFTVEVVTWTGLVRFHVLFVIDLATRRVEIAGITDQPHEAYMKQMARNLTDAVMASCSSIATSSWTATRSSATVSATCSRRAV